MLHTINLIASCIGYVVIVVTLWVIITETCGAGRYDGGWFVMIAGFGVSRVKAGTQAQKNMSMIYKTPADQQWHFLVPGWLKHKEAK